MKLIDLLVQELPKRGGWPVNKKHHAFISQDGNGEVWSFPSKPNLNIMKGIWGVSGDDGCYVGLITTIADDFTTSTVTREQYEAALAGNKAPAADADGWIEWHGGECPVKEGTLVDVRYRDGQELDAIPAKEIYPAKRDAQDAFWENDGMKQDIIAYRLHQSEQDEAAWNGEGLPPIGCEFEFGTHRTRAKCLGIGHHMIFASKGDPDDEDGDFEEFMISIMDSEFHPIRTETERRREEVTTKLRTCLAGTGAGITEHAASCLYDAIAAGKIPGVQLTNPVKS